MSQGLYLSQKMTLAQVLAPQLQQSLALLQAPTLELKAMVAKELEQNPILEEMLVEGQTQEQPHEEGDLPASVVDPAVRVENLTNTQAASQLAEADGAPAVRQELSQERLKLTS